MNKYSYETVLNKEQFDAQGNLLPSAVLSLFQDAAGEHGEKMGVGFERMLERGLLWVVTRIRYEVVKAPSPSQAIAVTTWPLPPTRLGFERNYLICDEQGELLIKGTSQWAVIDTKERKLAHFDGVYPEMEHCTEKTFSDRTRRLRDFEAGTPALTLTPNETTIDRNGHVNNTFYPDFALKALGGISGRLQTFQIDYLHEVLCGQALKLYCAKEENTSYVKGETEDGTRMFACAITLK